jgi:hypothetical protein
MRQESMTKDRIKDKTEPYNSENMNTQDPIWDCIGKTQLILLWLHFFIKQKLFLLLN